MEAIVWFEFRVLGCRSTAKGAPWASFRGFGRKKEEENPNHTRGGIGGMKTPQTPFLVPLAFYLPLGFLLLSLDTA
jgi:hypothetical protein